MADSQLHIATFALGEWMTNCYVVHVGDSSTCWIIDAGFEPRPLIDYVLEHNLTPRQIILTHAHVDHIAGLAEVRDVWPDIPILLHGDEHEFLGDPALNLSAFLAVPITAPPATATLSHGDTRSLDGIDFQVRHTPGHSPGGVTLYQPESAVAIVGDTLFASSIGRSDFPTSNGRTLMQSIREQLMTLPDETSALPGHGPATTIGAERRGNPFL
jgi:glyoxylase-like metal-dependent hydrolase (beta-lactamase superfamily II)